MLRLDIADYADTCKLAVDGNRDRQRRRWAGNLLKVGAGLDTCQTRE